MKKIFIKYNPYKVETNITIDDKSVKDNSALNINDGKRLQEWIEGLPMNLVEECNTKKFKVIFQGTILDYEDLLSVAKEATTKDIIIKCEHIPAKETEDKEQEIKKIFSDIQNGPFEEFKQPDIIATFENAIGKDFEVNVLATMSAGKSTLINALIGKKLMPAKSEACTATITKIRDMDLESFRAKAYAHKKLLSSHNELSLEEMEKLNSDDRVSEILVEGKIPFVKAGDVALVLVDTPGPNNSRDPEHSKATHRMIADSSKAVILYILNATQLAVNDDNDLLNRVSESMKVGGKQSKDRFIFVINKLDDFKQGEDSVERAIEKVRKYLEDKDIKNPNIFPAAALPALHIKSFNLNPSTLNEDEKYEMEFKAGKLNRNNDLHLEKYHMLPPSLESEITKILEQAKKNNDKNTEALVHTGIITIETVIRMYVAKYAKTAKIKNIVDTFYKKLESARSLENTKQEIVKNKNKNEEILFQIESIKKKLRSVDEANKFKDKVNAINYDTEVRLIANNVAKEVQKQISSKFQTNIEKVTCREAEDICKEFANYAAELQLGVQVRLEMIIEEHVEKACEDLLNEYKNKISDLVEEGVNIGSVNINPFEILNGEMNNMSNGTYISSTISGLAKNEKVKVGEEWEENEEKRWYKPWTWFDEDGKIKAIYAEQEFVKKNELAQKFFAPLQTQLYNNCDSAVKHAKEQTNTIKSTFDSRFKEVDKVLEQKLAELELCTKNNKDLEKIIEEGEKRIAWLNSIQARIEDILAI